MGWIAAMETNKKRRRGDRYDARRIRGLDSMHVIMPPMLPNRADNEAFIQEVVDVTALEAYLEKKNGENPEHRYTAFQAILAALGRAIDMRPRMNSFIKGGRYYQRDHISFSLVAKKVFSDTGAEALAILKYDPESGKSSMNEMHDKLCDFVYDLRVRDKKDGTTDTMDFITKMPFFLVKLCMNLLAWLDDHGHMPKSLLREDPYNSTVFITNLGSLKLRAGYHHLTNWGTNSIFVVVGERHLQPFFDDEGKAEMRPVIEIGLTLDERIADGYYYAKTVRLLKHLLTHPELLDTPAKEEIRCEY